MHDADTANPTAQMIGSPCLKYRRKKWLNISPKSISTIAAKSIQIGALNEREIHKYLQFFIRKWLCSKKKLTYYISLSSSNGVGISVGVAIGVAVGVKVWAEA
jgi:hypothetical protein